MARGIFLTRSFTLIFSSRLIFSFLSVAFRKVRSSLTDTSTPKYLYKAAMIGSELGKNSQALSFLKRIEKEFPEAQEAKLVEVQIAKIETLMQ